MSKKKNRTQTSKAPNFIKEQIKMVSPQNQSQSQEKPTFEEIKKEISSGKVVHVKLFDGTFWYLTEVGESQNRLYGRYRLCTGATRQGIYYDEIVKVVKIFVGDKDPDY